jgi:hypothetical protein
LVHCLNAAAQLDGKPVEKPPSEDKRRLSLAPAALRLEVLLGEHGHVLGLLLRQVLHALVEDLFGVTARNAVGFLLLFGAQLVIPDEGGTATDDAQDGQQWYQRKHGNLPKKGDTGLAFCAEGIIGSLFHPWRPASNATVSTASPTTLRREHGKQASPKDQPTQPFNAQPLARLIRGLDVTTCEYC